MLDTKTNKQHLLAPIDCENKTQIQSLANDEKPYNNTADEEEKAEREKWLSWLNSKIFWKLSEQPEQLMSEIFAHLPLKSILMFKCLSKYFLDLPKQNDFLLKQSDYRRDCITGFFGQRCLSHDNYVNPDDFDDIGYINIKSKFDSLPDPKLNFVKQRSDGNIVRLIDSCNGLLLCISYINSIKTCFVCNPVTKEKVALPHCLRRATRVNHALMADLDKEGKIKFKVLCLVRPKAHDDKGMEMLIFSSDTGEWKREIKQDYPPMHHATMMGSKVFYNGSLFWDCFDNYILVYHLNNKKSRQCYELIEAPRASLGRCLWKYSDKLFCYCHGYEGDFPSWLLATNENGEFEWKFEGCELFENMCRDILSFENDQMLINKQLQSLSQVRFKIVTYDPGVDKLYFWLKDILFSYRLYNREVERVGTFENNFHWFWKLKTKTCVLAHRHSLAQIERPKKGKAEEKESERDKKQKDNMLVSINEIHEKDDEGVSLYEICANKVKPRRRKGKGKTIENTRKESEKGEEEKIKDNDENCANKVRAKCRKVKIRFSLLQLDEE